MRRAGRSWEIVYDGGSLQSVQTAVGADLGLSVLSPLSLVPAIEAVGENAGLPPLPTADLALYSRKSPSQSTVQRLASFLISAVARWENDAHLGSDHALSAPGGPEPRFNGRLDVIPTNGSHDGTRSSR